MDDLKPSMPDLSQARETANTAMDQANKTMDQVKTMARNVTEQAWSAASSASATAQDLARKAREQVPDTLYEQGQRAGEYLTRNVNEYPLTAVLVAGVVGYLMAYLIHGRWQNQG